MIRSLILRCLIVALAAVTGVLPAAVAFAHAPSHVDGGQCGTVGKDPRHGADRSWAATLTAAGEAESGRNLRGHCVGETCPCIVAAPSGFPADMAVSAKMPPRGGALVAPGCCDPPPAKSGTA